MSMSESGGSPIGGSVAPVYHEVSPKWTQAVRVAGVVTFLMVALSFIFTLVQGAKNSSFYLMTCNLIITSFVGLVNSWWYRRGHLAADKYWFMLTLAGVVLFQCLTTDIVVFNLENSSAPILPTTTPATTNTTMHHNITTTVHS